MYTPILYACPLISLYECNNGVGDLNLALNVVSLNCASVPVFMCVCVCVCVIFLNIKIRPGVYKMCEQTSLYMWLLIPHVLSAGRGYFNLVCVKCV